MPCIAHMIQLALGAFMSSLCVKGCSKSWEAHERDLQFAKNDSTDCGNSQRLWIVGNATINKVSAMRAGLAKLIEKVCRSIYFQCAETDLHIVENASCIAQNASCIDFADTWLSKQDQWHWKCNSPECSATHYRLEDMFELNTAIAQAWFPILSFHTEVA